MTYIPVCSSVLSLWFVFVRLSSRFVSCLSVAFIACVRNPLLVCHWSVSAVSVSGVHCPLAAVLAERDRERDRLEGGSGSLTNNSMSSSNESLSSRSSRDLHNTASSSSSPYSRE